VPVAASITADYRDFMNEQASARELLERWQAGDESAAAELYDRFARQLLLFAGAHMGEKLRRRMAPDDIVQSAFRTFFRRIDQWHLQADRPAAIWHLLVRITLNKIRSKGEFHAAQQRSVDVEVPISNDDFDLRLVAREPTPDEAAIFAEELDRTFAGLDESQAQTLKLAIQGFTPSEIASRVGCSRWTVRRTLDRIGHRLLNRHVESAR
jgi:RNA polymerase sigma factor (sigma-70 family)